MEGGAPSMYCEDCGYTHWGREGCPRAKAMNNPWIQLIIEGLSDEAIETLDNLPDSHNGV